MRVVDMDPLIWAAILGWNTSELNVGAQSSFRTGTHPPRFHDVGLAPLEYASGG